jgi:hypothetical protein
MDSPKSPKIDTTGIIGNLKGVTLREECDCGNRATRIKFRTLICERCYQIEARQRETGDGDSPRPRSPGGEIEGFTLSPSFPTEKGETISADGYDESDPFTAFNRPDDHPTDE